MLTDWYAYVECICSSLLTRIPPVRYTTVNPTSLPLIFFGANSAMYTGTTVKRRLVQAVQTHYNSQSVGECSNLHENTYPVPNPAMNLPRYIILNRWHKT